MSRTRIQQSLDFTGLVRLMGVAAAVALFGVGMCGFLGYSKFKSALETATRSRMTVPAASVRSGVEAALALGVPLAGASATPALLARERAADAEIVAISVLDAHGQALFSTAPAHPGSGTGTSLRPVALPEDEGEVRMPLRNSFDLQLGEVVVRYATASSRDALARMRARLAVIVAAGWALTTLLAAAGLAMVARRAQPARAAPQA